MHLWKGEDEYAGFRTTLEEIRLRTFTTTTTPPLAPGELLNLSFMLENRRFVTRTRVVHPGVFALPLSLAQGQRRAEGRGPFDRSDRAEVFAVEAFADTFVQGRTLLGKLVDLSPGGLRMTLEELTGDGAPKRGDTFAQLCVSRLPFTPPILASATVTHVTPLDAGLSVGFHLTGLTDSDRKSIERIVARRAPPSFGQAFPAMKRKTDLADQPGPPRAALVKAKAPEVVKAPPPGPAAPALPVGRPPLTTAMRLRKPIRKVLLLSSHPDGPDLAEAFRQDGFKQVFEARSFLEVKRLARATRFDLLVLDAKVGGHWAKDILEVLNGEGLLLDTPRILVADSANVSIRTMAEDLAAVHIHGRTDTYEQLVPLVYRLLLE